MRTAYILTPIEFAGAESVSLAFLRHVDRSRHDIRPITLVRPWERENLFVQRLEKENYPIARVPVAIRAQTEGSDYLRVVRCYRMIRALLQQGCFDLVHTHGYFADLVGIPAAKQLNIPTLSTCHGFISNTLKYRFYNMCDRMALRFSTRVIAVSEGIKMNLVKHGVRESQITVIQNAVNNSGDRDSAARNRQKIRNRLALGDHAFVLGYVGRLSREKGIVSLIEACAMLRDNGVPVTAVIIGEGPQRPELQALVKHHRLEGVICFAGFQHDVQDWLPALDVFVLPSLTEGTPMSLLEAMASNLPVVASAVGGIPQVLSTEQNGILVPPGEPGEIRRAVQRLYDDRALRDRIARAAGRTVQERYGIRDWVDKIEQEYIKTRDRCDR